MKRSLSQTDGQTPAKDGKASASVKTEGEAWLVVEFSDAELFKKIIECLFQVGKECVMNCTASSLELSCDDSSHVSIAECALFGAQLESYRCDENMGIDLDLEILRKVLKPAKKYTHLKLSHQKHANTLMVQLGSSETPASYEVNLININKKPLQLPEIEHEILLAMPSAKLKNFFATFTTLSANYVNIKVNKKEKTASFATESQSGKSTTVLKDGVDDTKISGELKDPDDYNESFLIPKIVSMQNAGAFSEEVQIGLDDGAPVVIYYILPNELGQLVLAVAPLVSDSGEA